jgi:hypothetical protein
MTFHATKEIYRKEPPPSSNNEGVQIKAIWNLKLFIQKKKGI